MGKCPLECLYFFTIPKDLPHLSALFVEWVQLNKVVFLGCSSPVSEKVYPFVGFTEKPDTPFDLQILLFQKLSEESDPHVKELHGVRSFYMSSIQNRQKYHTKVQNHPISNSTFAVGSFPSLKSKGRPSKHNLHSRSLRVYACAFVGAEIGWSS